MEWIRLSFCCRRDGCRRRRLPPSIVFMGRRSYLAVTVVILGIFQNGPTPQRLQVIRRLISEQISFDTICRWREWWRKKFPSSKFWHEHRSDFIPPSPDPDMMPCSIYERFCGHGPPGGESLVKFLRLLSQMQEN